MISTNDMDVEPRRGLRTALRLSAAMALTCGATAAVGQTQKVMLDVVGAAGFTSSPFLADENSNSGASNSSVTFELSVLPRYSLIDERGSFTVEGNYRRIQYLRRYGNTDSYGVTASASRRLTETLDGNAYASFNSSILGEQGQRGIFEAPSSPSLPSPDGVAPTPLPEPTTGIGFIPPDLVVDVGLIGLRQRQSQLSAGAGLGYAISEIDRISGQVSATRVDYGGGLPLSNFQTYAGSVSYSRSLSEFTQIGALLSTQQTSYNALLSDSSVYQPQLTIATRFSPRWNLSAAAGLLLIRSDEVTGSGNSTGLSANVAATYTGERTSLSLNAFRDASASGLGGVSRIIGASIAQNIRLNQTDSVSVSANYSRSRQNGLLAQNGLPLPNDPILRTRSFSYASVNANYERRLTDRLNAGVSASYRDTFDSLGGRPADLTGQVFIRARIGDLR